MTMLRGLQFNLMIGAVLPQAVPSEIADALLSAQVTQATEGKSGFSLTFGFGKGSALRRRFEQGLFDPPNRMVLYVTVNGTPQVLMDGVITRHEVAVSNDPGQSRLTVTGEDLTRLLDLIDFSWLIKYPAMPAEARVALILAKYLPLGMLPMVLPSVNIDIPLPTERIPSHIGTDLQYVTYLANSVGYVFYVEPGPLPGVSIAYWGPEIKISEPQPALIVNSDAGSNVDSLNFGFDGFSKTLYVMMIRPEQVPVPIPIPIPDTNPLSPPLGARPPFPLRVEPLRGVAHYNPVQALMVGLAKAARAAEVISCTGSLNVLRYGRVLKPRRLVEVRGAGLPHDGLYFVRSVTNQIKPGEFKQNFTLSRNAFEPLSLPAVMLGGSAGTGLPAAGARPPGGLF
jgi:hypothetical protein